MKVMIEVGSSYLGLEAGKDVGAILSALSGAAIYQRAWSGDRPWAQSGTAENPATVKVEIVPDCAFLPLTPIVDALTTAVKQSESRWLEHYARANKAEAELKELKAKLATLQPKADE
jgi:hypothetical protein